MYLYLSNDQCVDIYPENKPQTFTTDLPQSLALHGDRSLGLLQVHIEAPSPIRTCFYIACNIIVNSYIGTDCYRILKFFTVDENSMNQSFGHIQYVPIENSGYIKAISLQLLDSDKLRPASLPIKKLTYTLHIKQDKPASLI